MDLALAGAYAGGGEPPAQAFGQGQRGGGRGGGGGGRGRGGGRRGQPRGRQPMEEDFGEEFEGVGELPVVDDLEVAAAAAAAAMEALAEGGEGSSSEEESSSEGGGSSGGWARGAGARGGRGQGAGAMGWRSAQRGAARRGGGCEVSVYPAGWPRRGPVVRLPALPALFCALESQLTLHGMQAARATATASGWRWTLGACLGRSASGWRWR